MGYVTVYALLSVLLHFKPIMVGLSDTSYFGSGEGGKKAPYPNLDCY